MKVMLFGRLADLAGWRERAFDPPPATLLALRALIEREFPDLAAALAGPSVQTALDKILVRGDRPLSGASEVAFLPPMSGG